MDSAVVICYDPARHSIPYLTRVSDSEWCCRRQLSRRRQCHLSNSAFAVAQVRARLPPPWCTAAAWRNTTAPVTLTVRRRSALPARAERPAIRSPSALARRILSCLARRVTAAAAEYRAAWRAVYRMKSNRSIAVALNLCGQREHPRHCHAWPRSSRSPSTVSATAASAAGTAAPATVTSRCFDCGAERPRGGGLRSPRCRQQYADLRLFPPVRTGSALPQSITYAGGSVTSTTPHDVSYAVLSTSGAGRNAKIADRRYRRLQQRRISDRFYAATPFSMG